MNRTNFHNVDRTGFKSMTVGSLLDDKINPRKRSYQDIEIKAREREVEERVARELVTMAMETDKPEQDVYVQADYSDQDLPDEIECQLIQKTLLINGAVQTIDFIMCNQCPRLFRTENLLWNHIKGKHNRRGVARKTVPPPPRSLPVNPSKRKCLEPGEINMDCINYEDVSNTQVEARLQDTEVEEEEEEETVDIVLVEPPDQSNINAQVQSTVMGAVEEEALERMETFQEDTSHIDGGQVDMYEQSHNTEDQSSNVTTTVVENDNTVEIQHSTEDVDDVDDNDPNMDVVYEVRDNTVRRVNSIPTATGIRHQHQSQSSRIDISGQQGKFICWNGKCSGEVFTNRKQVENHIRKIHGNLSVECEICGKHVSNIQRHREVSHKKFRGYDCSHCGDKFCTAEDLDRHLKNVEARNQVNWDSTASNDQSNSDKNKENSGAAETSKDETVDIAAVDSFIKQLESQMFKCSDCGVKTPSRMTYIQHVLSGCIMDCPQKSMRRERRPKHRRLPPSLAPVVTKHVIIQHDGRREHIIVEQDRELSDVVREQLGHKDDPSKQDLSKAKEGVQSSAKVSARLEEEDVDGDLEEVSDNQDRTSNIPTSQTTTSNRADSDRPFRPPNTAIPMTRPTQRIHLSSSGMSLSSTSSGSTTHGIQLASSVSKTPAVTEKTMVPTLSTAQPLTELPDQAEKESIAPNSTDNLEQNPHNTTTTTKSNNTAVIITTAANHTTTAAVVHTSPTSDVSQFHVQPEAAEKLIEPVQSETSSGGDNHPMVVQAQQGQIVEGVVDGEVVHFQEEAVVATDTATDSGDHQILHIVQDSTQQEEESPPQQHNQVREIGTTEQHAEHEQQQLFVQEGEDGETTAAVLQVVEGEQGEHVIHVTEEQLAQLQAQANIILTDC